MGTHDKTLEAIFTEPAPANIEWRAIENLFSSLGAEISEGRGARIRVFLNKRIAVFHRPHPRKEANKSNVRSVRKFLEEAGIEDPSK